MMELTATQTHARQQGRSLLRAVRSRPWLAGLAILLVLAVVGAVGWRAFSGEVSSGPNAFVLASGSTHADHINYRYRSFSGLVRQETTVTEGQTLEVTYAADVTKGSLEMEVKDAAGTDLWRVNVPTQQRTKGTGRVVAPHTGSYQVVVTGLDAGGSFDISWKAK